MAKLPLSELTGKPLELPSAPQRLIFFFTIDDLKLIKDLVKEKRAGDFPFEIIGVFLGTELSEIKAYQKANADFKIYKTPNIKNFQVFGVSDLPWVLFLEFKEVKISCKPEDLGIPLLESVSNRVNRSGSEAEENKEEPVDPALKIEELEAIAEQNKAEIDFLRSELSKRDQIISQVIEKL